MNNLNTTNLGLSLLIWALPCQAQTTVNEWEPNGTLAQSNDISSYLDSTNSVKLIGVSNDPSDLDCYRVTVAPGQRIDATFTGFNFVKSVVFKTWSYSISSEMPNFRGILDQIEYLRNCGYFFRKDPNRWYLKTDSCSNIYDVDYYGIEGTAAVDRTILPYFDITILDDAGNDITHALDSNSLGSLITDGVNLKSFNTPTAGWRNQGDTPRIIYIKVNKSATIIPGMITYPTQYTINFVSSS